MAAPTLQLGGLCARAQALHKRCARHCDSRWRWRAGCRYAAPGTEIWRVGSSTAAPDPLELRRFSADRTPMKQPHPHPHDLSSWESMRSRAQARTSPFFDQRIKLSFASEPNSTCHVLLATVTLGRRALVGVRLDRVGN